MPTGGSIQLARIFGIRIGVTLSWFVILFLLIFGFSANFQRTLDGSDTEAYLVAVGVALLLYASILLHELGHAVVAIRQGIEVKRIDLWFFGGLAQLSREPRSPGAEFAVAIAGPLVTLAIVLLCAVPATLLESSSQLTDAATLQSEATASPGYVLLSMLVTMNAILFVFNILPGFPLDGGRVVLAAAWKLTGDRNKAVRFAGRSGVAFAYLLGGFGLYLTLTGDSFDGIWLIVLAWLLAGAARAAIVQGQVGDQLARVTVADVMDPHPFTLDGSTTILEAREQVFEPHEDWPFVAVVDEHGRFLGVLERVTADAELEAGRPALAVREALPDDRAEWSIRTDQQLEDLLSAPALRGPGAVFAVDAGDVLRGVVTLDQVRRAISPAPGR
jgi:Zn-dependent protease/CBS domain-containing protein